MRRTLAVLLVFSALWVSQTAAACPVCFAPKNEENRMAFISMTGFLTALPLALIGGGVWWYRRRVIAHRRRVSREKRARRRRQSELQGGASTVRRAYFGTDYAGTPRGR